MSGSPLIQNGKLIGAVTHVLVDDPTRGYAIFAENMLETAQTVGEGLLSRVTYFTVCVRTYFTVFQNGQVEDHR